MTQPKLFTIPSDCSADDKKLFEAINRFLEHTGISADELDKQYRIRLLRSTYLLADSIAPEILHAYEQQKRTRLNFEGREFVDNIGTAIRDHLDEASIPQIYAIDGSNAPTFPQQPEKVADIVASQSQSHWNGFAVFITNWLNLELGRFQDYDVPNTIDPDGLFAHHMGEVGSDPKVNLDSLRKALPRATSATNLLQERLSQNEPFIAEKPDHFFIHLNQDGFNFAIKFPGTATVANNAFFGALAQVLADAGVAKNKLFDNAWQREATKNIAEIQGNLARRLREYEGKITRVYTKRPAAAESLIENLFTRKTIGIPDMDLLDQYPTSPLLAGLGAPTPPGGTLGARASAPLVAPPPPTEAPPKKGPQSYKFQNSPELDEAHQKFFAALEELNHAADCRGHEVELIMRARLMTTAVNAPPLIVPELFKAINADYEAALPVPDVKQTAATLMTDKFLIEKGLSATIREKTASAPTPDADTTVSEIRTALIPRMEKILPFLDIKGSGHFKGSEEAFEEALTVDGAHCPEAVKLCRLKSHDTMRSVFAAFRSGERKFCDLSTEPTIVPWQGYDLKFPSERDLVWSAIEQSAATFSSADPKRKKAITAALDNLKTAYEEACLSPQEREARAERQKIAKEQKAAADRLALEAQRKAVAEAAEQKRQQEEAAKLAFEEFSYGKAAQSLLERANATTSGDKLDALVVADVIARELQPLKGNLNANFPPHQEFGKAIFGNGKSEDGVVPALEKICITKPKGWKNSDTRKNGELWNNVLGRTFDDAPLPADATIEQQFTRKLEQANKERHGAVVKALENAPVLIVAAMGEHKRLEDMRKIQRALVAVENGIVLEGQPPPESADVLKHRRAWLAKQVLQAKSLPVPETLNVSEPPPEPVVVRSLPPTKPAAPKAAEASILPIITTSTTTTEPPSAATAPEEPAAPEVLLQAAKSQEQQKKDKIYEEAWLFVAEHAIERVPPFNVMKWEMGFQPGHSIRITLCRSSSRCDDAPEAPPSIDIPLQEPNFETSVEIADEITKRLLSDAELNLSAYIKPVANGFGTHHPNDLLPHCRPESKDGTVGSLERRQGGVYRLKLHFKPQEDGSNNKDFIVSIPLGIKPDANDAEQIARERRDLIARYLEHRAPRDQLKTQDLVERLKRDVASMPNASWDEPEHIDLHNDYPQLQTRFDIKYPVITEDSEPAFTQMTIGNPQFEGSPNGYWRIPIEIHAFEMINGAREKVGAFSTSVNTHVSSAEQATRRIPEIANHFIKSLENHTKNHPGQTHFLFQEDGILRQLEPDSIETHDKWNIDRNRISEIRDGLHYVTHLSVVASKPYELEDGRIGFSLATIRADGSLLRDYTDITKKKTKPMLRHFVLPAGTDEGVAKQRIEDFRANTERVLLKAVCSMVAHNIEVADAKSHVREHGIEISEKPRVHKSYNPSAVIKYFDEACADAITYDGTAKSNETTPNESELLKTCFTQNYGQQGVKPALPSQPVGIPGKK